MATTKSASATNLGRDSQPKYLGIKISEGQKAKIGQILVRQRGTKFNAGENVKRGGDDTLFAMKDGVVHITRKRKIGFNRAKKEIKIVNIKISR